ncbi:MAG: hypothetical protein K1X64_21995 [Myxococcaceae bacterium]|nr:hypothetical protein [Myxococcaceae bacterium]
MTDWLRRRNPEDVPTPVAIAVADYCRRAQAPASPSRVREALSLLSTDDDFRARALADGTPLAIPLGPFAVVDILLGTAPEVASQREQTGYYELVGSMVAQQEPPKPKPAKAATSLSAQPAARLSREPVELVESPRAAAKAQAKAESVRQRIAPVRRRFEDSIVATDSSPTVQEVESLAGPPPTPPAGTQWRRRDLPAPRGRFTRVEPPKQPWRYLMDASIKNDLVELIKQHGNRLAIHKVLGAQYEGRRRGSVLSVDEVVELLKHHGIFAALEAHERERLMSVLTEQKGFLAQTAHLFECTIDELQALITVIGLSEAVEALRERFRRESLASPNIRLQLKLVGRPKYLDDLGIRRRFEQFVSATLKKLIDETPGDDWNERLEGLSSAKALPLDGLKRAAVALKLKPRSASPHA